MSHAKKTQREVHAVLAEEGAVVLSVEMAKHMKIRIQTPRGPRLVVAPRRFSGSWREMENFRRDVRHALNGTLTKREPE